MLGIAVSFRISMHNGNHCETLQSYSEAGWVDMIFSESDLRRHRLSKCGLGFFACFREETMGETGDHGARDRRNPE